MMATSQSPHIPVVSFTRELSFLSLSSIETFLSHSFSNMDVCQDLDFSDVDSAVDNDSYDTRPHLPQRGINSYNIRLNLDYSVTRLR
jgi:hypothetical protein